MEEIEIGVLGLVAIRTNRWSKMYHLSQDGKRALCNSGDAPILPNEEPKPAGYATCMRCFGSETLRSLRYQEQREQLEKGVLYVGKRSPRGEKYHYVRYIEVDTGDTFGTKELVLRTMCGHIVMQTAFSEVESTELRATCMYCLGSPQTPKKYRDPIAEENVRHFRSKGGGDHTGIGPIW